MSWKEKLKKIKAEEKEKKEKAKEIASQLADELSLYIHRAYDTASELASVIHAQVKLFDLRHKEFDEETGKHFYTGGIILTIRKPASLFKKIMQKTSSKTILKVQFPHPKAVGKREAYDENIYLTYSGNTKIVHWKKFTITWMRNYFEEAYKIYLSQKK